MISSSRLDDDSRNFTSSVPQFCQKYIARVSFAAPSFPVHLLVRPWPPNRVAASAGESCGTHICPIPCLLCHLMYTRTVMVLQQMSQHSQHQSTARILVPSGPFGLTEQGLLFQHSSSSKFSDRVGTLAIYSILITDQQQIVCVGTIKYYSIPSVPSRLEGVKTCPHCE